jgi:hypothetical protein
MVGLQLRALVRGFAKFLPKILKHPMWLKQRAISQEFLKVRPVPRKNAPVREPIVRSFGGIDADYKLFIDFENSAKFGGRCRVQLGVREVAFA